MTEKDQNPNSNFYFLARLLFSVASGPTVLAESSDHKPQDRGQPAVPDAGELLAAGELGKNRPSLC